MRLLSVGPLLGTASFTLAGACTCGLQASESRHDQPPQVGKIAGTHTTPCGGGDDPPAHSSLPTAPFLLLQLRRLRRMRRYDAAAVADDAGPAFVCRGLPPLIRWNAAAAGSDAYTGACLARSFSLTLCGCAFRVAVQVGGERGAGGGAVCSVRPARLQHTTAPTAPAPRRTRPHRTPSSLLTVRNRIVFALCCGVFFCCLSAVGGLGLGRDGWVRRGPAAAAAAPARRRGPARRT